MPAKNAKAPHSSITSSKSGVARVHPNANSQCPAIPIDKASDRIRMGKISDPIRKGIENHPITHPTPCTKMAAIAALEACVALAAWRMVVVDICREIPR